MDKIIWLDGHTSSISTETTDRLQYVKGNKYYMNLDGSTFVWMANCWMEI